ncbi:single-strand DNA-binding protein [Enterococcus sp. AZ103]
MGRLTKDPDLRYTNTGLAVATFTLAVNHNFTNQSGNREVDFINCVIWRKQAENIANFAKKGSLMGITGRIQTRNYDNQQGQKVFVTEVLVENFQMLEPRNSTGQRSQNPNNFKNSNQAPAASNSDPFSGSQIDISDDDLPF